MFGQIATKATFKTFSRENIPQRQSTLLPTGILHSPYNIVRIGDLTISMKGKITKLFDGQKLPKENQEEVIFSYFNKYGDKCYEYFDGQFFIFLYDHKAETGYLFNNRYLSSTMYYYQAEEYFVFSSKLEHILKRCIESPKVNKGSVRSFISNGFTITDQTQIEGIRKMMPTFRIRINQEQVHINNHWDKELSFNRQPFSNLDDKIDEYEELYQDNIRRFTHYNNTRNLGTLLSGGHDTSFAMIHSSKVFNKPVEAFTTTFPGWQWDEEEFAKNICHQFGGNFNPLPFTSDNLDSIVSLIRANEEPVVGSSLPLHLIGKKATHQVDTILGGDGGDTLWGEYYPVAEYHRYIKHLPLPLRKLAHAVASGLVKVTDWERFWELKHVSSLFCTKNYYYNFMRRLCTYRHFDDSFQKKLFSDDFYRDSEIPSSILEIPFTKHNFQDALIEGKLFNAFYTYQSFHTYKSMEYYGLNLFFPTIGRDIMRFITNLPYEWVNGGNSIQRLSNSKSINRRLHKSALYRHLGPSQIYNRSFDIPWYNILKPRPQLLNKIAYHLKDRGWYNEQAIDSLFSDFMSQKVKTNELLELKHHGYRIFTLLSLEIWCKEFLDRKFTADFEDGMILDNYFS